MSIFERHELARLIRGSAFIFACRISGAILGFATQIYLARWMGAADLGVYVVSFAWCIVLALICGMGYPPAGMIIVSQSLATGDKARIKGFIRLSRRRVLSVSSTIALLSVVLMHSVDGLVSVDHRATLSMGLLWVPMYALMQLHEGIAHGYSRFALKFFPNLIGRPLLFFLMVAVLHSLQADALGPQNVMLLQAFAVLLVTAIPAWLLHRWLKPDLTDVTPVYESNQWAQTSVQLLVLSLYANYSADVNLIIAGFYLKPDEAAVFNASLRIAMLISFVVLAVDNFIRPRLAHLYTENNLPELRKLVTRTTHLMLWPAVSGFVVLLGAGKVLLGWFGDEFIAGYDVLLVLAAGQVWVAAMGPLASLLSVSGHQAYCLSVFAYALILTVVLGLILVPWLGIMGVAVSIVLVILFWTLWMHRLVVRHLGIIPSVLGWR